MINSIFLPTSNVYDPEANSAVIELEPHDLDYALEKSQCLKRVSRQWPCYIQAIALRGFQDWLQQRDQALVIQAETSSTLQPRYANVLDAVCNLRVGEFTICLLVTPEPRAATVEFPRAVIDLPEFTAHFYIAMSVDEDAEVSAIHGFLRFDQVEKLATDWQPGAWNEQLALTYFNSDLDELLLNLRCLNQEAIPLPQATYNLPAAPSVLLTDIVAVLPHLRTQSLQDLVPWQEGAILLQHSEVLELLYRWQTEPSESVGAAIDMQARVALLLQPAMNAATWMRGELDAIAQQLGLWLSPPRAAAIRWATYEENRDNTIRYLRRRGHKIPGGLIPVHHTVDWSDQQWHLCLLAWPQASHNESPVESSSWSLLLLLIARSGDCIPAGTCLQVSSQAGVQRQECLKYEGAVLFTTVDGVYGERFITTVLSPTAEPLVLLPCTFTTDAPQ